MFIITMINGEIEWMSRNEDTLEEWSNDWFYRTIPEISLSLKKLKESENTNMNYLHYTVKLQTNALSFNLLPIYST